jgi:homoserine O-succinyltransferase/O-acetyltransferase
MPLVIEGGRIPPRWSERAGSRPAISIDSYEWRSECVKIAFVNNMPDPALEDTEIQFFQLLEGAAGDISLRIKLYSLPGIPRGERGERHLSSFYWAFDDLWNSQFDAVIVTGTEPRSANLPGEPYWPVLTELLEWAERNTVSAILSCLAAHASVLHGDGVERHRLNDKRLGVFEFSEASEHLITNETTEPIRFPHSRWNEVREDELIGCGYTILTKSPDAGVDAFVKRKKNSLFVHFQGHPEYGACTLLKEYRRDIKRFLRGERESYPSMPQGYFGTVATRLLTAFRESALSDLREEVMTAFPESAIVGTLRNGWYSCATSMYRNWLQHVKSRKPEISASVALSSLPDHIYRKRSVIR